jgi:DNA polymerase sigma
MDIAELKARVLRLRCMLQAHSVHFDGALLFGSRAKGTYTESSDTDIAIISISYGFDRMAESSLLNLLAKRCIPYCEAVPVGLRDYLDPNCISPILHEIKKHGKIIL